MAEEELVRKEKGVAQVPINLVTLPRFYLFNLLIWSFAFLLLYQLTE